MESNEKQKWDDYYRSEIPVNPPEVVELGDEFRAWIQRLLPPGKRKLLEAGCGAGAQSLAFAQAEGFETHLLDGSEPALSVARDLFKHHGVKGHFHLGDIFGEGRPEFDLVFNAGVIEHYSFNDQVRMVRAMAARSRGLIAVLAPNAGCYWYWVSRLRNASSGAWPFGLEAPVSNLRSVFEAAGVRLVEEKFLGRSWASLFFRNLPEIAPELKNILAECHGSALIPDEHACYLYGAVAAVDASAQPPNHQRSSGFLEDSMRATAADALAVRIAGEVDLRAEKSQTESLRRECSAAHAELARAQSELQFSKAETHARAVEAESLRSELTDTQSEMAGLRLDRHQLIDTKAEVARLDTAMTFLRAEARTHDEANAVAIESLQNELRRAENQSRQAKNEAARLQSDLTVAVAERDRAFVRLEADTAVLAARISEIDRTLETKCAELEVFQSAVQAYHSEFEEALSTYRSQRAWRLMLMARKMYELWTRRGWRSKLQMQSLLWKASARKSIADQELRFPSIKQFLPLPLIEQSPEPKSPAPQPDEPAWELVPNSSLQRKYDIVVLAIIDFDFRFQRPQQIAAQFARNGHRVFWVSPTRYVAPDSETPYRIRPLRENLWEVNLKGTQPDIYLGKLDSQTRESLEASLRSLYRDRAVSENVALVQLPFWRGLAISLRQEHGAVIVYDCMDEWDSFENMGEFNRLEEQSLVAECDLLVVTADKLAKKFASRGLSPMLVRNGVDYDFFQTAPTTSELKDIPRPIVGYFGAIADWIDLDLVYEVAKARPSYSFVLIGQVFGRDTSALEALPNVHLLGNQPYERIPSYLRAFDTCMIPFLLNHVTQATDPVKLYEYLSHGKAVVATDMGELSFQRGLLYIAKDAAEFAAKLDVACAENDAQLKAARLEFAQRNTWCARVETIDRAVCEKFPLISIIIVTHNSSRFIGPCLDSVWRNSSYPNFEVIVVDNASTDGTDGIVSSHASGRGSFRCDLLDINCGFAAANNRGAQAARGDYIVFLNADTIVTPGWLGRLSAHLRRDPSIGLICPATNFAGNEAKINIRYKDEASMEQFAVWLASQVRGESTTLEMAPLFCAMMSRVLFHEVGGLDERYGIGMFEDDDLSMAIRKRGLRVCVAEDTFVHHFGQGSFAKLKPEEYNRLFEANRRQFEEKWGSGWRPHKLRLGVLPPFEEAKFQPEGFCGVHPPQIPLQVSAAKS